MFQLLHLFLPIAIFLQNTRAHTNTHTHTHSPIGKHLLLNLFLRGRIEIKEEKIGGKSVEEGESEDCEGDDVNDDHDVAEEEEG